MKHNHFITLPYDQDHAAPALGDDGIVYPAALVRHFLKEFTKKGDRVLDPFAGFGTTLFVAESMGRVPYGIESERERFEWTAGQLEKWQNIHHADAGSLASLKLPRMDFVMTSPPFMAADHTWNPLYSGNPKHRGYANYLKRLGNIFGGIAGVMKKGAVCVVQVDNIRGPKVFTPLVHDMTRMIGTSLKLSDEKIIRWNDGPADYPYTQCLIFKKS